MITDTTSTPAFIDTPPDWSRPVVVTSRWDTPIQVNREGGEQRAAIMARPKLVITYQRGAIRPGPFSLMRARAMNEVGKAVVVPVWTEFGSALSFAANAVTLSATITSLKFKVGGWIYATQGATSGFRKITSVSVATINLSSAGADFFPVGFSWGSLTAGARIYPCILGLRSGNSFRIGLKRVDRASPSFTVEEL